MKLYYTENNITFTRDKNSFEYENFTIWFSGYFFINDSYYSHKEAAVLLCKWYLQNKLNNEIGTCNGIFTFLIIDEVANKLTIGTDRFGFIRLFFYKTEKYIRISNKYWELAETEANSSVNNLAIAEFLLFRHVLQGNSLLKGFSDFDPASLYTIATKNNEISINQNTYWKLEYKPVNYSRDQTEKKIYNTLNSVFYKYKKNLFDNAKVGLNLTGGIDSRLLLTFLLRYKNRSDSIINFTFGTKNSDDIKIASILSKSTNTKHSKALFNDPLFDFFEANTIDNILSQIGSHCYYFQGFGVTKLMPLHKEVDYLLTGADGFYFGHVAAEQLRNLKNHKELTNYIIKNNASILDPGSIEQISSIDMSIYEDKIKNSILSSFSSEMSIISNYYNWLLRNRVRNYILSIYEIQNTNCQLILPYYDYTFIDLMLSLPFEALLDQQGYINSICKNAFVKDYDYLKSVPIEKRFLKRSQDEFELVAKTPNLIQRALKKIFSLPDNEYAYNIYGTYKWHKREVMEMIDLLLQEKSRFLNKKRIQKMIKEKSGNEIFFRYALPVILSVARLEVKVARLKKIENE